MPTLNIDKLQKDLDKVYKELTDIEKSIVNDFENFMRDFIIFIEVGGDKLSIEKYKEGYKNLLKSHNLTEEDLIVVKLMEFKLNNKSVGLLEYVILKFIIQDVQKYGQNIVVKFLYLFETVRDVIKTYLENKETSFN